MLARLHALALCLLLLAVAGCARASAMDLATWQLEVPGEPVSTLTLPAHVDIASGAESFVLWRQIALPEHFRGQRLRLRVNGWQGPIELAVGDGPFEGGVSSHAYRGDGHATFLVPSLATAHPELTLRLRVTHRWAKSEWLDVVPVLDMAPESVPRADVAATTEHVGNFLAFGILFALAFLHAAMFATDRNRREYGWFALFALVGLTYPLFVSAWFEESLGFSEAVLLGVGQAFSPVLGYALSRSAFGAPPVQRWHWLAPSLAAFVGVTARPFALSVFSWTVVAAMVPACAAHAIFLFRLARRNVPNAALILVTWTVTTAVTSTFDGRYFMGTGFLGGGVRVGSFALALLALVHAYLLAAAHVRALRTAETLQRDAMLTLDDLRAKDERLTALNQELQRQVAERSKELSHALARLVDVGGSVPALTTGDLIDGRYSIVRPLGNGGMGNVYLATSRVHGDCPVALKLLRGTPDAVALARFAREARLAATVTHPNVVRVLDVGIACGGFLFLVMEHVEGPSLAQCRARYGDERWASQVLRDTAAALAALHGRSIVHRDVKPANVVLDHGHGEAVAKLVDFGIAAELTGEPERQEPSDDESTLQKAAHTAASSHFELTRGSAVLGTPNYMSPEVLEGAPATPESDVFSFGVMAFELLTQRRPFDGPAAVAILRGVRCPRVGTKLGRLVERCLALDPKARPSASELTNMLTSHVNAFGHEAHP